MSQRPNRLSVSRETVRELSTEEAGKVAGGGPTQPATCQSCAYSLVRCVSDLICKVG
ncbi:MAG TPA: hypothetical protein VG245_00800 [Candidatus Dormibacteraeota bacterium]|jgi:hypothetical protein|nr:hypothetical protein [Candidatus Dormibacteraeota bacterium]